MSFVLHGIGVSGGIAIGRAQLVSHATLEVAHYSIAPEQVSAEIERLTQALHAVQKELEGLHGAMTSGDAPAEFGAFLDVHWMILTDPTLSEVPKRTIAMPPETPMPWRTKLIESDDQRTRLIPVCAPR